MTRELAKHTTVGGVTYAPGPVSDEVAAQITVESVWVEESDKDKSSAPAKKAAAKRSTSK